MAKSSPNPLTILHVRPSDPRRTAIVEYADHFRRALDRVPNAAVVDFLPSDLSEKIDSQSDREAVKVYVSRLAKPYREWKTPLVVHVEEGNSLHREFWAGVQLQKALPRARFFCTIHDPPTLSSNPFRYVNTEYEGKTPIRLCDVALTKGAETMVGFLRHRVEARFIRRCEGVAALKDGGVEAMRNHSLFRGAKLLRINHAFSFDSLASSARGETGASTSESKKDLTTALFGFIGPDKGIEDLLVAFRNLVQRLEREKSPLTQRLKIFGASPPTPHGKAYVEELRNRISGLFRADRIEFTPGFVENDERDRLLGGVDIMAMPFRPVRKVVFSSAGLIRGMALGKAIVASRSGMIEEEIVDGENGLLHDAGDVDALSDCLYRLTLDASLRKRLGDSARQHIMAEHAETPLAKELEQIYRDNKS